MGGERGKLLCGVCILDRGHLGYGNYTIISGGLTLIVGCPVGGKVETYCGSRTGVWVH